MECPNDETLYALVEGNLRGEALDAVDSHLDACPLCRELVATLTSGTRESREGGVPKALGRFAVQREIGVGAMGVVYAAHDPELDRMVALKVLHAAIDSAQARARLAREAQAMARLTHPHVITVHDVGAEGEQAFVAMELVNGASLRERMQRGDLSVEAKRRILRQAGEGLAAAHEAGLVHRDFKPENVLVDTRDDAKVGDFGLARSGRDEDAALGDDEAPISATLTRTGALLGTPAYMAPEQLHGDVADARSDQYAFAVTAWELLTGTRPFAGTSSIGELRALVDSGPPPSPPQLSPHVARALRRALAPRPTERHDDMRSLLAAMDEPPARSARGAIALGLVSVTALGAAAIALASQSRSTEPPCAAAERAFASSWGPSFESTSLEPAAVATLSAWAERWRSARVDACEATHVRHEQSEAHLDLRMACLDRQQAAFDAARDALASPLAGPEVLATLPNPDVCADVVGRLAPPPASLRAIVDALDDEIAVARVQLAAPDVDAVANRVDGLVERAQAAGYAPTLARALLLRASVRSATSRYDDALEDGHAALFAAEGASDDRTAADAWLSLARIAGEAGRYREAAAFIGYANAAITRAGEPQDLVEPMLRLRGIARMELGDLDGAEADLDTALESTRARAGEESAQLAPILVSLGNLAGLDGDYPRALSFHERALALDREAWGARHPRVGRDLHNVAGTLRRLERRDEARAHYREAYAILRGALGQDHPEVALTANSLGLLAFEAGDDEEARARWEEALATFAQHEHGDAARVHYNLALLALRQVRWDEARVHAEAAIDADRRRLGDDAKRVGIEHLALGRALRGMEREAEARQAFERARAIGEAVPDAHLVAEAGELLAEGTAPHTHTRRDVPGTTTASVAAPASSAEATVTATSAEPAAPPVGAEAVAPPTQAEPPPQLAPAGRTGSGAYGGGQAWD